MLPRGVRALHTVSRSLGSWAFRPALCFEGVEKLYGVLRKCRGTSFGAALSC